MVTDNCWQVLALLPTDQLRAWIGHPKRSPLRSGLHRYGRTPVRPLTPDHHLQQRIIVGGFRLSNGEILWLDMLRQLKNMVGQG